MLARVVLLRLYIHACTNTLSWSHLIPPSCPLQIPRGAPHIVLTASYDGTVRALDINKGVSWSLYDDSDGKGISAMDTHAVVADATTAIGTGLAVWAGSYDGKILSFDTRSPSAAVSFQAHDRKVSAISSLHSSHYLLSSGGDGVVRLWDVRKGSSSMTRGHALPASEVGLLRSTQSITSAFFSPNAQRIVATCSDNKLRVWDLREDVAALPEGENAAVIRNRRQTKHAGL